MGRRTQSRNLSSTREPMRIAMLSTPFLAVPPAAYGGTELIVHELTEGLPACGVDVTLFATGDSHTSAELRSLYPRPEWPPEPLADVNHVSWAMAQVQRGGFDLVHAHSAMALALGRLAPQLPIVYTVHHEREEHLSAFYRYFPEVAPESAGKSAMARIRDAIFQGSAERMFAQLVAGEDLSPQALARMRRLLDRKLREAP